MGNPVVHFEIISSNGEGSREFYSSVFGWSFNTDNPLNYGAADTGAEGAGIGGGVSDKYPGSDDTYVTFYIGVEDVTTSLEQIVAAGGTVAMPPIDLPGGAKMAQFFDPFGSRLGLLQS